MRIEVLYFDGCPSWQDALAHVKAALGDGQAVALVKIDTPEQAESERFAGSPTIRVDGHDLFPVGNEQYALACRMYLTPDGASGAPTVDMIRDALAHVVSKF